LPTLFAGFDDKLFHYLVFCEDDTETSCVTDEWSCVLYKFTKRASHQVISCLFVGGERALWKRYFH